MAHIEPALLEYWLRDYYFNARYDLSSSGVEDFSVRDLKELIGLDLRQFDDMYFHDSPALGSEELREALAQQYGQSSDSVMVGNGSSEVIFLLMHALFNKGDEIVVVSPCYPALRQVAESFGCVIHDWELSYDDGFKPDINKLAELLSDKTKAVVINFPHNPTGATLTHEQQSELVGLLESRSIYLIWDAVFADMQYGTPLLDFHQLYDKTISLGTLSKAYGLPGMRVGWAFAPDNVLQQCVHWRDYTSICLSPLIEGIATHVLQNASKLIDLRCQQAQKNIAIVQSWANEQSEHVHWIPPSGGVSTFPRFTEFEDVTSFCRELVNEQGVLLAPGSCFGYPSHARLGLGGCSVKLQTGLDLLSEKLQTTSNGKQV